MDFLKGTIEQGSVPYSKRGISQSLLKQNKTKNKATNKQKHMEHPGGEKRFGVWRIVSPIKLLQRVGEQMQKVDQKDRLLQTVKIMLPMQWHLNFIL